MDIIKTTEQKIRLNNVDATISHESVDLVLNCNDNDRGIVIKQADIDDVIAILEQCKKLLDNKGETK